MVSVCGLRLYKEDCGLWRLCMRQRDRVMCKQEKLGRRARSEARAGLHLCHNGCSCAWRSSNVYELCYAGPAWVACNGGVGRWVIGRASRAVHSHSQHSQRAGPATSSGKQHQAASACRQ